jgi:excisionase family DNA binding protein
MNTNGGERKRAYSIREAAPVLGVSERFLYECARTKRIYAVRLGNRWIIPANVLTALLNERESDTEMPISANA